MPEAEMTLAYCHVCGAAMDVSAVAPFSNVECPECGKHTRVKREFGPYTLLRRHAIGGMSVVFVAHDNTLDREVALKILNEDYSADEKRIAAFEEEARITASISHPHVVRVLTTGRAFDRFFIAMELVTGGHFEHPIRERGALPELEVLPLAIQVAEGLQAAHAAGLIHRDVKPGNILLDAAGNAKIVDFGLSLVTKGGKAQANEIWATPYYVPPETIEGLEEDFRSDVYAFGATIYHALAGVPSCSEESMVTTILRRSKQTVKPLAVAAPRLSAETCAVIDRAMAYRSKDRFGSYDEMIAALRMALQRVKSSPSSPQMDSKALRRQRAARRGHQLILWSSVAVAGLALIGVIMRLSRDHTKAAKAALASDSSLEAVSQVEPDSTLDLGKASRIGRRYLEAHEALTKGEFAMASTEFAALRDDPEVQEPTRTWAGVEAVIAAYLNDRPADARREARATSRHLSGAMSVDPSMRSTLSGTLTQLNELPSIPPGQLDPAAGDAPLMMAWMLSGLKDWEQGRLLEAAEFFKAAVAVTLKESDGWARFYQNVAQRYLADGERLQAAELGSVPSEKSDCEKQLAALDQVLSSLETRGRARFNVQEWQLMLTRRMHELSRVPGAGPPPVIAASFSAIRSQIDSLNSEFRFAEAALKLKSVKPTPEEKALWDSMLALTAAATPFLPDLEEGLGHLDRLIELKTKDGSATFTRAAVSRPGRLEVSTAGGEKREIGWNELSPDSIIELHRTLVRTVKTDQEKLRHHEAAIAFDWLAGDRARAKAAAERLSVENPAFKKHWESIAPGLK
jgi:eukaryotic-like serine/threonine-protein kinase